MNIYKKYRKEKNLTQKQLAEILHVEQSTISKWETGASIPDNETLIKLSDFFKVSIDELLGKKTITKFPTNEIKQDELSKNKKVLIDLIKTFNDDEVYIILGFVSKLTDIPLDEVFKKIKE